MGGGGVTAPMAMVHGGPDAAGVAAHDFSTNANACGPCPEVLEALRVADRQHYPDPHYTHLRVQLGAWHGVAPERIVLAASSSEFIQRMTAWAVRSGVSQVRVPAHGYGDYSRAAQAWGLPLHHSAAACGHVPALQWACCPASPLGLPDAELARSAQAAAGHTVVLDCAYRPLVLQGQSAPPPDEAWQMWSPNKALGMTGVRAAYAVAPVQAVASGHVAALQALAPSWPVGAEGVALLQCWTQPSVQAWLAQAREVLCAWKGQQLTLCAAMGWAVVPGSQANYFVARPPLADLGALPDLLAVLRAHGVQLRDCASFGLPGHVRLGVRPPASQQALLAAWQAWA
jgi:histidinol-phosphate aminotransferase